MKSQLLHRRNILMYCLWLSLVLPGQLSLAHSNAGHASATLKLQQSTVVNGRITSTSDGESLPGVNVIIKGTSVGTVTDADGRYSIDVPGRESVLVFSSIGFETEEIAVGEKTVIDVVMTPSITSLQEIVVVGYGTQEKISVTSSVGEIESEDLVRRPVTSLQQAMQGKVPGLTIVDNGGSPGSPNAHIIVRGVNTPYTPPGQGPIAISQIGNNSPLVIIDGIEQPFQNINPQDIESISVLKDASSSAIYGSRAANGVILITTKRAKEGKVSVSYNGFYAIQKAISKPEHMDIESYLRMQNTARQNVGSAPLYTEDRIQEYTTGSVTDPLKYPLPFDWYNVIFSNASQVNHSLSVSGGSENLKARFSLRRQDQDGIIANTNSKITDVRVNTDFKISPKISVATDLNYRYQNDLEPNNINEIFRQLMQNSIWAVPKYPNGNYGGGTQGNNPLLLAEKGGTYNTQSNYLLGNVMGKWEILKGLKFTTQVAVRSNNIAVKNFVNTWETRDSTVLKKTNLINRLTEGRTNIREITINNLLDYAVDFQSHGIKVLAGYSQIKHENNSINASRQSFYNNDVTSIGQGANDATKDNSGGDFEWGLRSYFARLNYSFKGKYLLEANARYDGSSRFVGDNRYSFFPSFSAGWRISEEKFWSGLERYVSDLKVRGSWGETGNQAVALYSYYPTLSTVTYNFNNTVVQGLEQRTLADPDLTWETTKQTDIGLDAEILQGKFLLTVDYYKKTTSGILLVLPIPGAMGLQAGPQNAGIVENRGWEFQLGTNHNWNKFTLNTNLNFSVNNNEVIDLAGTGPYITGNDIDPRYIIDEGYPINAFWGYKTGGLFQTDDEASSYPQFMRTALAGDVKILDLNEDGVITPADMTLLENSFPRYTFGGSINLSYQAFTLNIALQGAADVGMRIARALGEQGNFEGFTPDIYTNNYWTPERPNARFPRPTKQNLRNQASTDRMIIDASYLRFKNIQLSYQLPSELTRRAFLERASVYVSGTNLITFSKLNEWNLDPESSSGWQNYYPQTALYTLGVNLQF